MAAFPEKVCPHLHVSLQSGSDAVLRRMRRRWCSKRIIDRCRLFQDTLDRPALTTDVIVGFPGETDADFQATCRVVREIGFSKIHKFPFSPRRGTPATEMPHQVPPLEKTARLDQLELLEAELRGRYYNSLRGTLLRVLIESPVENRPGRMLGTACRYTPVELPGTIAMRKQFASVVAGETSSGRIWAAGCAS
jgi:threonylcarbamoyladenosine tRNA methylthiotransferase MtaB